MLPKTLPLTWMSPSLSQVPFHSKELIDDGMSGWVDFVITG